MKVAVDAGKCVSAGNCASLAPGIFDQDDDDGSVILLDDSPGAERADEVRAAEIACPAQAITVTE